MAYNQRDQQPYDRPTLAIVTLCFALETTLSILNIDLYTETAEIAKALLFRLRYRDIRKGHGYVLCWANFKATNL